MLRLVIYNYFDVRDIPRPCCLYRVTWIKKSISQHEKNDSVEFPRKITFVYIIKDHQFAWTASNEIYFFVLEQHQEIQTKIFVIFWRLFACATKKITRSWLFDKLGNQISTSQVLDVMDILENTFSAILPKGGSSEVFNDPKNKTFSKIYY